MVSKVRSVNIKGNQNREVMEQLSACTGNVEKLHTINSENINSWLSADILSRWKLKDIYLSGGSITPALILCIVQTCTELTSIRLYTDTMDDAVVIDIAQHCPKLEILKLSGFTTIRCDPLITLSDYKLPLKELDIPCIPNIPTADIASRCSHALSCIRDLRTLRLHRQEDDASLIISHITGLTSVCIDYRGPTYIPLLTQYCHKLNQLEVYDAKCTSTGILSLCRANPLLQHVYCYLCSVITDTVLIQLIHACPHLHTLCLPYETTITNIGILALTEHCPQLQWLNIENCTQVTETAVLQLLLRCRKLTRLYVSSSSLSEETWAQLDKNTQKRVRRW